MAAKSLREQLEETWDAQDEDEEQEESGGPGEDTEEPVGPSEEEGEETPGADEESGEESEDEEAGPDDKDDAAEEEGADAAEAESSADSGAVKAPASWRPTAREYWSKLPKEVQQEVQRREAHVMNALRESAETRRFAQEFQQVIHPFEPLIASQNSTPLQAVKNLMTTAAGLTIGTPQQKAQIAANIIQQYGVDIETLDSLLAGQPVQPGAGSGPLPSQIQQVLQNELAPFRQFMGQISQQKQSYETQQEARIQQELEQFKTTHDFYEDVREDMADLMDLAAQRGQAMTLEDAYDRACHMNPEVRGLLARRQAAQSAGQRRQTIAKKRKAASSISGAARRSDKGASADSLRSALEEAWDDHSGE